MSIQFLTALHILFVILWIGPAAGGYYMSYYAWRKEGLTYQDWPEKALEHILRLEHISFLGIMLTGFFLFQKSKGGLLETEWFPMKMGIVLFILLFEIYDSWLHHYYIKKNAADPLIKSQIYFHKRVLGFISIPVFIGIGVVLRLAIYKFV
jgi:hypothetical protein